MVKKDIESKKSKILEENMTERINQYIEINKIHGNKKVNSIELIIYINYESRNYRGRCLWNDECYPS